MHARESDGSTRQCPDITDDQAKETKRLYEKKATKPVKITAAESGCGGGGRAAILLSWTSLLPPVVVQVTLKIVAIFQFVLSFRRRNIVLRWLFNLCGSAIVSRWVSRNVVGACSIKVTGGAEVDCFAIGTLVSDPC